MYSLYSIYVAKVVKAANMWKSQPFHTTKEYYEACPATKGKIHVFLHKTIGNEI